MPKRIFRTLILISFILGIFGCSGESTKSALNMPQQMDSLEISQQPSQQSKEIHGSDSYPSQSVPNSTTNSSILSETQAVRILYYHSVMLEDGNEVRMPPDQFEAQMVYLKEHGFQSISLEQLYQAFYLGGSLPAKPFVITFDDGYVDNYSTAFPILKKHGFTATVFMVSDYIDGEGFLSWPQLKELAANGWEIEGHTATHPDLTKSDHRTLLLELKNSKDMIEKGLGKRVDFLAYPYGAYNFVVKQAVRDAGYLMALTTERGWATLNMDALQIKRIYCFANMGQNEFSQRIQNPNY